MADIVIPPALRHARSSFRYIDQTGVTRGIYTGAAQTVSYGGDRVGASIDFTPHGGRSTLNKSERAQLISFLMSLQGRQNRVYIADAANDTSQGSFPATELFTNYDFSSGTTGWTATGGGTLTVSDGIARLSVDSQLSNPSFYQYASIPVAYAPYVVRSIVVEGAQSAGLNIGPFIGDLGGIASSDYLTTRGYRMASIVAATAGSSAQYPIVFANTSGYTAGAYASCHFASFSRCFLVDGGGNLTLRPKELDNASWTKTRATVSANAGIAPDGTVTADKLIEDGTAANTHYISQSIARTSATADLCTYGYFCRSVGTRNVQLYSGNGGADYAQCLFDLGAGTAGSVTHAGTATNGRAFIASAGNGWYFCALVSRAQAAATVLAQAAMASGTNINYSGDSTSALGVWGFGTAVSSVPTRGTITNTSAAASASTQTGSSIYVKGLPASTNDLLKAGRWIEIDGQLKVVTAPLNSDAAGLGYLQFSPPLRRAVSDNTPVIVCRPMGRFLFAGDAPGWDNSPGVFSNASLEFEEAFS